MGEESGLIAGVPKEGGWGPIYPPIFPNFRLKITGLKIPSQARKRQKILKNSMSVNSGTFISLKLSVRVYMPSRFKLNNCL